MSTPRILLAALTLAGLAPAQSLRYRDPVFATVDVTSNLAYGSAIDRFTQQPVTLLLDVYEPRGDTATARAAIVLVHGGGFTGGNKSVAAMRRTATDLARAGYVVASIDYRLAPSASQVTAAVIRDAAHDMKAALRWLRRHATTWRIDTGRIAGMGSSAGAFTALDAAYDADEGNSGNPGFDSSQRCVVDLWGALSELASIDLGEAPLFIVHGTADPVVPFTGATSLRDRAQQAGVPFEFHPLQGAGHAPWDLYWTTKFADTLAFLFERMQLERVVGLAADPGYASPGNLTLRTHGVANELWLLAISNSGATPQPLGDLGFLVLDPASTIVAAMGSLPATPRIASASYAIVIPAGMGGSSFTWQVVQSSPSAPRSLTNGVVTAF